jgi:large subunit ribosomal protein L6e
MMRINGVPLRRVNQAYVIATSTKVDASSITIPETVNDAFFAKAKAAKSSKEGEFFGEGKDKAPVSEDKKSEQKVCLPPELISWINSNVQSIVDALVAAVKKVDNLAQYLKAPWGLSRSDRFHELKF